MSDALTLYHYYRSSSSWRVRWGMKLKQVPCTMVPLNLLEGEQRAPWFLAKNPMGQVPCLETQGECFGESMAILEWLEERYPTPALLPQDPLSRMRVRGLCYLITSGTQPLQNLAAQRYYSTDREAQLVYARHWIRQGLAAYEQLLTTQALAGTYSFGHQVSMADLCLVPQCYNAERFSVNLEEFPSVAGIYRRCMETPACQETAPSAQ
jgi:maleylacetoacetate isomerase